MLYEYVIPLDVIITIDTHHIYINNIIYVIYNKIYKKIAPEPFKLKGLPAGARFPTGSQLPLASI